jgi:hypothetical protein
VNATQTCQVVSSSPWTDAAIVATALGALVFVISYAVTTRGAWRSSIVGWNVMAFMTVVLLVSTLAVVAIFFGTNWPFREAIRSVAWTMVAAVIWWRVAILYRAQHPPPR